MDVGPLHFYFITSLLVDMYDISDRIDKLYSDEKIEEK